MEQLIRATEPQSGARPRLMIVISHPIQHFGPMYRSIAADGRVDLLVVFAEAGAEPRFDSGFGHVIQWQEDILEGYRHVFVGTEKAKRNEAVLDEMRRFKPDVVYVHGYAEAYLRAVMRSAVRAGIPVLMTTDSELRHARPWPVRVMKKLLLPRILRQVAMFLTVGDENERYFEHYGVGRERFHRVPFSIDSEYYDKVLSGKDEVRRRTREQIGIPEDAVAILTVGKLIPRKGQADLVRAFTEALRSAKRPAVLLIAGDGSERARLEKLAKPLGSAVKMLGFVNVQQLPATYLAADIYVHPSSHDPHPLSISEALYCGLPVVVSDRVGSIGPTDDVQPGRSGWVYPHGDVSALAEILRSLIDDPGAREDAGRAGLEIGRAHSSANSGRLFVEGALRALGRR